MKKIYKILLKMALVCSNFTYKVISFLAIKTEGGLHPKYRLIKYNEFFLSNISSNDEVLDIGCGHGSLAHDIGSKAKLVVGIDILESKIKIAESKYHRPNIKYVVGDVTKDLGNRRFDVIILSNVLEHIEHRVSFLKDIKGLAPRFLIRVPMFDRDWIPLYKKELGLEWRLDLTHFTEFTKASFCKELGEAGYHIDDFSVQYGEIWAVVTP